MESRNARMIIVAGIASLVSIAVGIDVFIHPTSIFGFPSAVILVIGIPSFIFGGAVAFPATYAWKKRISWIIAILLSGGSLAIGIYAFKNATTWPTIAAGWLCAVGLPALLLLGLLFYRLQEAKANRSHATQEGS